MKYIFLGTDNTVREIIPGEDPVFPGIPIEERYAPDFIAQLLPVEDGMEVEQNWVYDPETASFAPPSVEGAETEEGAADTPATVSILDGMTVAQLKEYAANNDIDLGGATKKADIRAAIEAGKETV